MSDLLIIHELLYGEFQWPAELHSDIGRISYFARENNISLEQLELAIDKFLSIYHKDKKHTSEFVSLTLYKESIHKAIKARRILIGNFPGVLDTPLYSDNHEYAARIYKNKETDKYSVQIIQKRRDNQLGERTGVPNAEYWDGTPGQYYATTLLGWDKFGGGRTGGDILVIDGGTNWSVRGMNALRAEIEKKYGDKIRKELHESIKAKKVYENLK